MKEDRKKSNEEFEDEFDLGDLDGEDDEDFAADGNSGRSFWLVTLGMAALILIVVGGLFYYTGAWKSAAPKPAEPMPAAVGGVDTPLPEMTIPALLTAEKANLPDRPLATATRVYENTPLAAAFTATLAQSDSAEDDARTATVAALLTESAQVATQPMTTPVQVTEAPVVLVTPPADPTLIPVTPLATALPDTGWADEVGMPFMLALAGALILVIILTRIMRSSRT